MKFVWNVEVTVDKDNEKNWVNDVFNIFKIKTEREYEVQESKVSKTHSWFLTLYKACYELRKDGKFRNYIGAIDHSLVTLEDIMPRYSRYEGKKFLIIVLSYNPYLQYNFENIMVAQKRLSKFLERRFEGQLISNFSVKVKIEQATELVKIQNPVPIVPLKEYRQLDTPSNWNKFYAQGYIKHFLIQYNGISKKKDNEKEPVEYIRELQMIYQADSIEEDGEDTNKRSSFYDRVHTEFLFFIRGSHMEKELEATFGEINFLVKLVDFIEGQWLKIRTLFSIMPRFSISNKSLSSKLFFYLLEVNAQIFSLLSKIQFEFEQTKQTYDEAFERLQFTIQKDGNDKEIEYYQYIDEIVHSSFNAYTKKLQMLEIATNRLRENIHELRADFDSNTNVIMQWLMFLLSIVLVVWGAVTLIYDKWVDTFDNAISNPIYLVIGGVFGALAVTLIFYLAIAKIWLNSSSTVLDKKVRKQIEMWINGSADTTCDTYLIEAYYDENQTGDTFKQKILNHFQLCCLLITAVALNNMKADEAIGKIEELNKTYNNIGKDK